MSSAAVTLISLSISGSVLAALLLALRPLLKHRVSKAFTYYLWLIVLLRFALPIGTPVNAMGALFAEVVDVQASAYTNATGVAVSQADETTFASAVAETVVSEQTFDVWAFLSDNAVWIWAAGTAVSMAWFAGAYLRCCHRIKKTSESARPEDMAALESLCASNRVKLLCNRFIETPMLIGVLRPTIVIPRRAYTLDELGNILRHELTHYRRHDLLYKWIVVLVTSLHWFNPLMPLIRREISRDCELSCDEAVIRGMTDDGRQAYGDTLLSLAASKRLPAGILATTLCERRSELKERLISIMKHKKQTIWMAALSLVMAVAFAGCGAVLGAVTDNGGNGTVTAIGAERNVGSEAATAVESNETLTPAQIAAQKKERQDEIEQGYAMYKSFGLTYDRDKDLFFYDGQVVRYFKDAVSLSETNGFFYENGVIDLTGERNAAGELTGLVKATQAEFDARTAERAKLKSEFDGAVAEVTEAVTFESGEPGAHDSSLDPYKPYGVSYDEAAKVWMFDGKQISLFWDEGYMTMSDGSVKDGIGVMAVRNGTGQIVKLAEMTAADFAKVTD